MRIARMALVLALVAVAATWLPAGDTWAGKNWKKVLDTEDRMLDESFTMKRDGKLRVTVHDSDIRLQHGNGNEARVEVFVSGRNRDKATEYFEKLDFRVELDGNTLRVETHRPTWGINNWWNNNSNNIHVLAVVTIPSGTDMAVRTSDGDISAETLEGVMNLRTSDGDVTVDGMEGERIELRTSDGDIELGSARGGMLAVTTSDGDVRVQDVEASEISFRTSDGDVTVEKAKGDDIRLRTSDGDIRAAVEGKKFRGRTSDGSIAVTLNGSMAVELQTSDGDIRIDAPENLRADINLRGENVRLMGGIDIQGEISKRKVVGTLGGGGEEILARCSDGTISLELH